jgi:hypothetical protein
MKTGIICFLLFCFLSLVAGETILPFRGIGHYEDGTADSTKGVSLEVDAFSPTWSVLNTGGAPNWVTISGCGFRTYAEAVCVWDFQVTSPVSYITSDNEIVCQVPTRELSEFQSLPATSRLDVVFDGNSGNDENILYVGPFQWGPNIDCETPISPTRGHTTGDSIEISGRGFTDAALGDVNVWFDDAPGTGCSVSSDTTISCSGAAPVDEIHRYALVSVTFGATDFYNRGDVEVYLHSTEFYRYGPIIEDVSGCTSAFGGDEITITGVGFSDGILNVRPLSPDQNNDDNIDDEAGVNGTFSGTELRSGVALVRVSPTASFTDKETGSNVAFVEVWANIDSDTQMTFTAPNFFDNVHDEDDADPDDFDSFFATMLGSPTANVEVFYRQTRRLTPFNGGSFTYGPWVEADSLDVSQWHAGGDDRICVDGCFIDYQNDEAEFMLSGTDICDGTSTVGDFQICCTTVLDQCGDDEDDTVSFDVRLSSVEYDDADRDLSPAFDDIIIGPIIETIADDADYLGRTFVDAPTLTFTGTNLMYTASTSFDDFDLTVSSGDATGLDSNFNININSDNSGSVSWDDIADIGYSTRTFELTFDMNTGSSITCIRQFTADFGPVCDSISPWNGRISGGDTVTVHGWFASGDNSNYDAQVRLLDTSRSDCDLTDTDITCGSQNDNDDIDAVPFQFVDNEISLNRETGTFQTPVFDTDLDLGRGRRWWGQEYEVVLMLDSAADAAFSTSDNSGYEWNSLRDCSTSCTDEISVAFLRCGSYRFGPVTETLMPCKGPINGGTSVTVGGSAFDDDWYDKDGTHSRADSPHVMTFGSVLGDWMTSSLSNSALTQTQKWGAQARMDQRNSGVTVIFDACNMTAPIKDDQDNLVTIYWGPRFYTQIDDTPHWGIEADAAVDQDAAGTIWGAFPLNNGAGVGPGATTQSIFAYVQGLHEYCALSASDCNNIRVLVDGLQANFATTANDDEISIALPGRPFGTSASVCIEFGRVECNDHDSPFRFDDAGKERTNWKNTICAEQKVNYMPTITDRSLDADITSGGETGIALTLLGFNGDWVNEVTTKVYVGDYPAGNPTAAVNSITYDNPTDVFEFNTDVSVRVSFELSTTGGETNTWETTDSIERFQGFLLPCELAGENNKTMHWTIWADDFHFGPSCGALAYSPSAGTIQQPILDAVANNYDATLAGTFLQDCSFAACASGTGVNDTFPHPPCEVPQFSDRFQAPFSLNDGAGVFSCVHRQIYVIHEFDTDSVSIGAPHDRDDALNEVTDSLDGSWGPSSTGDFRVPPHPQNCGWVNFALYFPDALVSDESQRYVQCGDDKDYSYGPSADSVGSIWINDDGDTIYGYGYNHVDCTIDAVTNAIPANCPANHKDYIVSVGGSRWDDEFFTEDDQSSPRDDADVFRPVVMFGNSVPSGDYSDSHDYSDGDNFVWRLVPVRSFGSESSMSIGWFQRSSATGSIVSNSELDACTIQLPWTFHWGPVLVESDLDGCSSSVDLSDPNDDIDSTSDVVISGRAFECCGFQLLSGPVAAKGQGYTYCDFGIEDPDIAAFSSPLAQEGSSLSTITCNVPANLDPSDRMYAFGIAFGQDECTVDDCDINTPAVNQLGDNNAEQAAHNYMDICYGPKWTGGITNRNWSGLRSGTCPGDHDDDRDANRVPISGFGFTSSSSYMNDTTVVCQWDNSDDTFGEIINDGSILCEIDIYRKQCGDGNDLIGIQFLEVGVSGSTTTYNQNGFARSGTAASPGFAAENGDEELQTVVYGPQFVYDSFSASNSNDGTNIYDPLNNSTIGFELRVFTDPHAQGAGDTAEISFVATYTEDWTCSGDSANDEFAQTSDANIICLFENTRSLAGAGDSGDEFTIAARSSLAENACYVPRGRFGEMSNVRIIVDPHYDEWTNFAVESDNDDLDRNDLTGVTFVNPFWHWIPYTTSVSKTWSQANGLEPVTVYGSGFCFYDSVVCRFSGVDAVQGDIIADHMVVCQTPPNQGPAATTLELTFCDSATDCECDFGCDASPDSAFPTQNFNFTGISDVWPVSGPIQGNTVVSFVGTGLESYNRVECVWHLGEGEFREEMMMNQCVSPASSQGLVHVEIIGYWYHWNSTESDFLGGLVHDFYFDFGEPNVDSVTPLTTEPGFLGNDTLITVTGSYFNGGLPDPTLNGTGVYECRWAIGSNTFSDDPRELGSSANFGNSLTTLGVRVDWVDNRFGRPVDSYQVVCPAPTDGFDRIGAYPFSVTFSAGFEMKAEFNFDVVPSSLLSINGWESDPSYRSGDDNDPDAFYYIPNVPFDIDLTIFGSGLFGGRQESSEHSSGYLVRFGESTANPDVTVFSVGNLLPTEDGLMTIPVPRDIWKNSTGDSNGYVDIPVAVSVDGGYTWSGEIDITYRRDGDLLDCIESGSAGTLTISLALVASAILAVLF